MSLKKNEIIFIIINILVPLIVGTFIYYCLAPNIFFIQEINALFNLQIKYLNYDNSALLTFIRNYGLDILWAYALMSSLFLIFHKQKTILPFLIAILFSVTIELLQLTPLIKGTFDCQDILLEILTEGIVFLILSNFAWGRIENEKQI